MTFKEDKTAKVVPVSKKNIGIKKIENTSVKNVPNTLRINGNQAVRKQHQMAFIKANFLESDSVNHASGSQGLKKLVNIQAKLKIGVSGDRHEDEADRVAEQILNPSKPEIEVKGERRTIKQESYLQTKKDVKLSKQSGSINGLDSHDKSISDLGNQIQGMEGSGQALNSKVLHFFESRFGQDFRQVRVHTDPRSADTAKTLNARAYTSGNNVVFGAGEYRPDTSSGKRLLAHELTHVVQQRQGGGKKDLIQRREGPATPYPAGVKYLAELRKSLTIKGTSRARKIATKIVNPYWVKGYPHFILSITLKALIIEELLNYLNQKKSLPANYEEAITLLIEGMSEAELDLIFTGVIKKQIEKTFGKARKTRITAHEKSVAGSVKPSLETFDPDKLIELRDRFFSNAQKPKKPEKTKPAKKWRKVCIDILERELSKVYSGDKAKKPVDKAIKSAGSKITVNKEVLGAHSIVNLGHRLTQGKIVVANFTTDYGRVKDKEKIKIPAANMNKSAWKWVKKSVGKQNGWHLFIMSILNGFHSVSLFVEKRPGKEILLYLADQNWTGHTGFLHGAGSMAGFKRYSGEAGFDRYLDIATHAFWNSAYDKKAKSLRKSDPKISKSDIYASSANSKTTLKIWKLGRKSKKSPIVLKTPLPVATTTTTAKAVSSKNFQYLIRSGDSISVIASRYGITPEKLRSMNGMAKGATHIEAGKHLKIPVPVNTHIFEKGDDLDKIAKKYKITEAKILELNKNLKPAKIKYQDPIIVR